MFELTCSHDENKNVRLTCSKHICLNDMLVKRNWNVEISYVRIDKFAEQNQNHEYDMFVRIFESNISKWCDCNTNNVSRQILRKSNLFFLYWNTIKLIIR